MIEEKLDEQEQLIDNGQGLGGPGVLDQLGMNDEKTELDKIFDKMLDPVNLYHFTELSQAEINAFSALGVLADEYDLVILKKWIIDNLKLRVSKQRKGKAEFVKITARNGSYEQPQQRNSPWGFFRHER